MGVSAAIVFESQLARAARRARCAPATARRGLLVLVLAYLFRLQEHILAGFWGGWAQVFRVDILNCIGASLLLLALVGVPRGRPPALPAAALAAARASSASVPSWARRTSPPGSPGPLSSYIGGQRPMSWFPLFPWGAWALVGLVVGHLWLRHGRDAAGQARAASG